MHVLDLRAMLVGTSTQLRPITYRDGSRLKQRFTSLRCLLFNSLNLISQVSYIIAVLRFDLLKHQEL